jgi:3-hydroxyisobutyrate dehydrogenase-like beta-hydroxyacid dehydrogenase
MSKYGFMGLGTMGLPMAVNAAKAGLDLMVFNRTQVKAETVLEAGAKAADSPEALLKWADALVMMLTGPQAIEDTLGSILREKPELFKGKLVVNMGTNPPSYENDLAVRLEAVGAAFVDSPVFGSREPAEQGSLIVLASGPAEALEQMTPLYDAVGSKTVNCGQVPKASMMKLAVNLVTVAAGEGLAEGVNFAQKGGLDLQTFLGLILNGPVGNAFFAMKAEKYLKEDYSEQASIGTVHEMLKHVVDTAHEIKACVPNTMSNLNLITRAVNKGLAQEDACAIIKVL